MGFGAMPGSATLTTWNPAAPARQAVLLRFRVLGLREGGADVSFSWDFVSRLCLI